MTLPVGCRVETLDERRCKDVLEWLSGAARPTVVSGDVYWLLAHCRDGVTWGFFDRDTSLWRVSSNPFPDLCPQVSEANVIRLRLFGPDEETLIRRVDEGFTGRRLLDEPSADRNAPTSPEDEIRVLLGDRMLDGPKDGFTRVATASGMEHAVPMQCSPEDFKGGRMPLRLKVRNYFSQDPSTGAVRVVAGRLLNVFKVTEAP
jgi:CRISPR-associated protein (TIGR03984 family)